MNADRFTRAALVLGDEALERLQQATVAVMGLGAVGSFALEALVRTGVGHIVLADFDEIRETNFNRQLLATEQTRGMLKADAARDRVLAINPECTVEIRPEFIGSETSDKYMDGSINLILDCIDSLGPKTGLMVDCFRKGQPFISSMGAGNKTDPTQVRAGDISEVGNTPLAGRIRKRLKRAGIATGVRCIYSTEKPVKITTAPEEDFYKRGRSRSPVGSVVYVTGVFGMVMAAEAVKVLTKTNVQHPAFNFQHSNISNC